LAATRHALEKAFELAYLPGPLDAELRAAARRLVGVTGLRLEAVLSVSGAECVQDASHVVLPGRMADSEMLEAIGLMERSPAERVLVSLRKIPSWIREQHRDCAVAYATTHLDFVTSFLVTRASILSEMYVYRFGVCHTEEVEEPQSRLAEMRKRLSVEDIDAALMGPEAPLAHGASSLRRSKMQLLDPRRVWKRLWQPWHLEEDEAAALMYEGTGETWARLIFYSVAYTVAILIFLILVVLTLDRHMNGYIVNFLTASLDPRWLAQCSLAGLVCLVMIAIVDEDAFGPPDRASLPSTKALVFKISSMVALLLGSVLLVSFANGRVGAVVTM